MKKWMLMAMVLGSAQAAGVQVSATTTIMADFVKAVGGERVQVNVIVPVGTDTHTFQPGTGVIRDLARSRMLFANGAGLEPWLPKLRAAAPKVPVTELTKGLKLHAAAEHDEHGDHDEHEGHDDHDAHDAHDHGAFDPHAWWDAGLAAQYVSNVEKALIAIDPQGKATYAKNAQRYRQEIAKADAYAKKQFATLPAAKRQIVTNHDALGYFAEHYGLKVVGQVIPGLTTEREPSPQELAKLVETVKKSGVKVIFTENTVAPRLAQTLAREAGMKIAPPLYTDALGPKGSAGATYLSALRYNVDTIVKALK